MASISIRPTVASKPITSPVGPKFRPFTVPDSLRGPKGVQALSRDKSGLGSPKKGQESQRNKKQNRTIDKAVPSFGSCLWLTRVLFYQWISKFLNNPLLEMSKFALMSWQILTIPTGHTVTPLTPHHRPLCSANSKRSFQYASHMGPAFPTEQGQKAESEGFPLQALVAILFVFKALIILTPF